MFICWTYCRHTIFSIRISQEIQDRFFEVVDPRLSLLRLIHKGIITEDVKSHINTSNAKDACEVLYYHANVDTLREYCKVAIDAKGYPKMQSLGRKMMEELEQGGWSELCAHLCGGCVCGGGESVCTLNSLGFESKLSGHLNEMSKGH